ncbi:hypothetical protein [Shinella pollutisoli]|uniref:Uncharacterized protein n=1 Tax=Shinella pollutisoli TaxID=2250594 RepID=A0ABV7DLH5_9HYPH|nr:hypothetical protein [Shinella pollutisoli]
MEIDLRLFGVAAEPAGYDGLAARRDVFADRAAPVLDTKAEAAADPLGDMQGMLVEMTKELRERFQRFQSQKVSAERAAEDAGDEAARKLAQADAKAAIEAVSLIVRTLEKIDSLQRALVAERIAAEEAAGGPDDLDALAAEFERLVEEKVAERMNARIAEGQEREGGAVAEEWAGGPLCRPPPSGLPAISPSKGEIGRT